MPKSSNPLGFTDKEYIAELEKVVIFMCDVYTKGADSLSVQEKDNEVDEKWWGVFMTFPTIQGTMNRIAVKDIGNLRNQRLNFETPNISFSELLEHLKVGRRSKTDA